MPTLFLQKGCKSCEGATFCWEFWFALAIKDGIVNTNLEYDNGKLFWYRFKQFCNKAIELVFILYAILPHEVCL